MKGDKKTEEKGQKSGEIQLLRKEKGLFTLLFLFKFHFDIDFSFLIFIFVPSLCPNSITMIDFPKIKNNLVVSSNDLVHAKYDLSLWQKRVFVYAISQLERDDKMFETIRMNIADIIRFFKASDGQSSYNAIIEAPKSLDKTIEIPYVTETGGFRYGFVKLLQKYSTPADTKTDNQYIEICFNNDLKPHLLDLKEKFLKYDIRNIIELQSTYSFRFFEMLKSYEYRNSVELGIDYLRTVLEVTNTYTSYKDFKRRIIDKAREDLTKFCDITFSYEEKKAPKGKKIEALIFYIQKNKPSHRSGDDDRFSSKKTKSTDIIVVPKGDIKTDDIVDSKGDKKTEVIEVLMNEESVQEKIIVELSPVVVTQFGVSLKVFMGLVEKHSEGEIRQAVQVTEKAMQAGKIENTAGFFVEAVRGNYKDMEQQKKEKEVLKVAEKKAKAEEKKKIEQEKEELKKQEHKQVFEKKKAIFERLIEDDDTFWTELEESIKTDNMIKNRYDFQKDVFENMQNSMIAGVLIAIATKLRGKEFE